MRYRLLIASILVIAVGCASYQLEQQASTQPITNQQRIDALRSDLTTFEDGVLLAEALHKFTPAQKTSVQEFEHSAEVALSTAQLAVNTKLTTADDAIKAATSAILLFKSNVK